MIALALGLFGYGLRTTLTRAQAAEAIVSRLRSTAPQFYADAQALVADGDFQHALTKIDCAVALDPSRAEYFFLKGHICESLLLIEPALASYWQAVALQPGYSAAQKNLELCRKIRGSVRGAVPPRASTPFTRSCSARAGSPKRSTWPSVSAPTTS